MYTAIDIGQLAKYSVTYWLPLASAANVAQGAAALAVAVKSKDQKIKSLALPSSLSAFMGITEPAIFGVNLRYFKPFVCGCIGGACGALFASVTQLGASGTGVTGIFGILLCLNMPVQYLLMMVISVGVSFVLTWIFGYKEEVPADSKVPEITEKAADEIEKAAGETAEKAAEDMTETVLYAPIQGNVIPREDIPDETFASGVLGDGVGIEPELGEVTAPFDGEISSLTDTRHAIGITGPGGMEVLIHVGVDTVKMNGDGFTLFVKEGDKVKAGQKLMTFDIEKIREAGYSTTSAVLLTNSDDYASCNILKTGSTKQMEKIISVEK